MVKIFFFFVNFLKPRFVLRKRSEKLIEPLSPLKLYLAESKVEFIFKAEVYATQANSTYLLLEER